MEVVLLFFFFFFSSLSFLLFDFQLDRNRGVNRVEVRLFCLGYNSYSSLFVLATSEIMDCFNDRSEFLVFYLA